MGFRINGLDSFERALLETIKVKFPQEIEKELQRLALDLEGTIKRRTPVDTGRLRGSFTTGRVKKIGGEWYIEVGTNVEYAEHIEYGHRTANGGFVPGIKMVEVSVTQLEQRLPIKMRAWLRRMLREFEL
ncbi:HK97 gp10 family phage protein [Crassaminicella thermophila]|uniref:HK97 gp10 family phage protein n=1 Tax=Crassaminicella thermophila TaxID=2599308 RepID=A0A5C0SCP0_CRATE|nr:HK97 gp10 family phage protein [Crassaminicella thermophila]QEK11692.1 HK97 gp10 family phage protein [Crassaminicella thermophila]